MDAAVVDASVAVKWVVQEEGSEAAASLIGLELTAPTLFIVECANALWAKSRRGELAPEEMGGRIALLQNAPVELVPSESLIEEATELALRLKHPVYDCIYLARWGNGWTRSSSPPIGDLPMRSGAPRKRLVEFSS